MPGFSASSATTNSSSAFVSDFSNVFGQPEASAGGATAGAALFGDVLQPAGGAALSQHSKMLTGDLDSSLANLASNLDFGSKGQKGFHGAARGPPMTQGGFQQQAVAQHPFL